MSTPTIKGDSPHASGPADRPQEHRQTRDLAEDKKEISPMPVGRVGPEPTGPAGKPSGRFGERDAD
jgi:hypothetical protein